jgi:rare lipoprotein A
LSPPPPSEPASAPSLPAATPILGKASWYGTFHHGRPTASGEIFNMHALTAAHRTLPLGTRVRVTNVANGRSVDVRVNDRGPFIRNRMIDLSRAAAAALGAIERGVFPVEVVVLE